jgi:phosphotransferase system  glucose/maltose/N-acetylglucosamine-specific IIC component
MAGSEPGGLDTRRGVTALPGGTGELVDLVIAYGQQELVGPVQRQIRSLGRAIGGAVLMATGTVLLALGFLRALQVEFGGVGHLPSSVVYGSSGALSGNWSWVPYVVAMVFCLLVAAFCVLRIMRGNER